MSKYNKVILTDAGLELASKAAKGKAKFTITKTAATAEKLADKSEKELQQLTELPNIEQYGEIKDVADTAHKGGVVIGVGLHFDNKDITKGYDLNTIGVYAREEGSDHELLYAITTAIEPETLPDYQNEVLFDFNITMYVVVGRSDNVTVTVSEEGLVTDKIFEEKIKVLASKEDLTALSNRLDGNLSDLQKQLRDEIKSLYPLNSPNGNNIYDIQINLDTFSTVGITKFLNCQLKSTGAMSGFDQATDKLYGWIFNVPKWNGASELQQIICICNYGQGTLTYARSRVNGEGTNVENFEKILTDKDLKVYADGVKDQIKNAGNVKSATINGGSVVTPDEQGNLLLQVDTYTKDESDKTFVKTVDGLKPDSTGNVQTDHYSNAEVDKRNLDLQNQITANLHKTMKTWVGTLEQYQTMPTHEPMTMYFIISDYEVVVK